PLCVAHRVASGCRPATSVGPEGSTLPDVSKKPLDIPARPLKLCSAVSIACLWSYRTSSRRFLPKLGPHFVAAHFFRRRGSRLQKSLGSAGRLPGSDPVPGRVTRRPRDRSA